MTQTHQLSDVKRKQNKFKTTLVWLFDVVNWNQTEELDLRLQSLLTNRDQTRTSTVFALQCQLCTST